MALVQKTVFENADIRQIEVSDAWEVRVVADSANSYVEVEYSAYLEPYLKTKMEGTKLEIGFTGNVYPAINSVFRAIVHTGKIEKIEASEASRLNFFGHFAATSDTLHIGLDDASMCSGLDYSGHICNISIEDASHFLDFHLSGYNCEVKASDASTYKGIFDMSWHFGVELGSASQLVTFGGGAPYNTIKLQDASLLNMAQSDMHEAFVDLSGASEATVKVDGMIDGSARDSSTLYLMGNPENNIDCDESSSVIPL